MQVVFPPMSQEVKPRRRYDASGRRERAAQNRRDLVVAAGALFGERGYVGTAMPAIAETTGVAVETIYRAFGSKAGLFKAVVEAAVAGGASRAEVPVEERPAIRAVIDEPDPRRKLELYAATQPGIHRRSGPLLRVLAEAARVDPELEVLREEMETGRLMGLGRFMAGLAEMGALRSDLSVDAARDVIWTVCSLEVHDRLIVQRGWSSEQYESWLASTLIDALLAPPHAPHPRRRSRARLI